MKILTLCLSPNLGGLELYAHNVGKMLSRDGIEHYSVVTAKGALATRLSEEQQGFYTLRNGFKFLPVFSAIRLARWITQLEIDVIHIHWNRDLKLAVLAKLFSRRKVKLVYSRHMQITRSKKDPYHRMLYKQVDCLITHTKLSRREAVQFLPVAEHKIKLSYLGTSVPPPANEQACNDFFQDTALANKNAEFKIGLFGRIEHGKGQHVLVEAMKILQAQNIEHVVGLVGHVMDDDYFSKLKQDIHATGLEGRLHYFGFIDNPVQFMNCFDVIVLTTYAETFGLVVIEAMHSGVVVVATNAGGVPEIITHNVDGVLFEPGNHQELASRLANLYHDPGRRQKLAKAGQVTAQNRFSQQGHFEELKQILSKLTASLSY